MTLQQTAWSRGIHTFSSAPPERIHLLGVALLASMNKVMLPTDGSAVYLEDAVLSVQCTVSYGYTKALKVHQVRC